MQLCKQEVYFSCNTKFDLFTEGDLIAKLLMSKAISMLSLYLVLCGSKWLHSKSMRYSWGIDIYEMFNNSYNKAQYHISSLLVSYVGHMIISFSGSETWDFEFEFPWIFYGRAFPKLLACTDTSRKNVCVCNILFKTTDQISSTPWSYSFTFFSLSFFFPFYLSSLSWLNSDRRTPISCIVLVMEGLSLSAAWNQGVATLWTEANGEQLTSQDNTLTCNVIMQPAHPKSGLEEHIESGRGGR